jgi:hypothetical protein
VHGAAFGSANVTIDATVAPFSIGQQSLIVSLAVAPSRAITDVVASDISLGFCEDGSDAIDVERTEAGDGNVTFTVTLPPSPEVLIRTLFDRCLKCHVKVRAEMISFCVTSDGPAATISPVPISTAEAVNTMRDHSPHIVWIAVGFLACLMFLFIALPVSVGIRGARARR